MRSDAAEVPDGEKPSGRAAPPPLPCPGLRPVSSGPAPRPCSSGGGAGRPGRIRLGLIINPIAGMGGAVGLHGTDGDSYRRAEELGAAPIAEKRAARALRRLASALPDLCLLAASGKMGEDAARNAGFCVEAVPVRPQPTSSEDTKHAARAMKSAGAALILFAGGDGTARDVAAAVGAETPMLGIPTGVKMHSAVFGAAPEAAGAMAARFVQSPGRVPVLPREVLDAGGGRGGVTEFSVASVPYVRDLLQPGKASAPVGGGFQVDRLCAGLAAGMDRGRLYVIGPGTTAKRILDHLGLGGNAAGVDAVLGGEMVLSDASESQLLELLETGRPAAVFLGVIGGQGFLLGRGNQQISPAVIEQVGEENVMILADEQKVRSLDPPVLRVDTGVETPRPVMLGYRRVHTGPGRSIVMKVVA